jgi:pyruvate-ferredoxin/flavodoxin oxidoreductase
LASAWPSISSGNRPSRLLRQLAGQLDPALVEALLDADESNEAEVFEQRERVKSLREALTGMDDDHARRLLRLAENLCRKSVWCIGGDGWAYDIGYGGLDHVLASGEDINILVLDTEVYSNTGGQTSKATPRGAVAKFSAGGKAVAKKDLALLAMEYPDVYVAHVAYGAKDTQTIKAFLEAEAHPGPSLIIAFSPCIAHGVDLSNNHRQQDMAVKSGHWPLFRFDPARLAKGQRVRCSSTRSRRACRTGSTWSQKPVSACSGTRIRKTPSGLPRRRSVISTRASSTTSSSPRWTGARAKP